MITALIIYLSVSIISTILFKYLPFDEDDIDKYFGLFGMWVIFALIFIPAYIWMWWIENWDCESNKTKGHEFYDKLYK